MAVLFKRVWRDDVPYPFCSVMETPNRRRTPPMYIDETGARLAAGMPSRNADFPIGAMSNGEFTLAASIEQAVDSIAPAAHGFLMAVLVDKTVLREIPRSPGRFFSEEVIPVAVYEVTMPSQGNTQSPDLYLIEGRDAAGFLTGSDGMRCPLWISRLWPSTNIRRRPRRRLSQTSIFSGGSNGKQTRKSCDTRHA